MRFFGAWQVHRSSHMIGSKGDGAWIMAKCAECLQGSCKYTFSERHTTFELSCPALARFDDALLDTARLGEEANVWAVAVDDCSFQRMILEHILSQLGLPEAPPEAAAMLSRYADTAVAA